jgi:hypothetical protein
MQKDIRQKEAIKMGSFVVCASQKVSEDGREKD